MINGFPTAASVFYALRDDRTNFCTPLRRYQDATCILYLSSAVAEMRDAQVAFVVAANLLSRWCRRVTLIAPRAALYPGLGSTSDDVVETALKQMSDADPFGSFNAQVSPLRSQHDIALCIGDDVPDLPVACPVFVNSFGWLAGISQRRPSLVPRTENRNCVGAIAAACLGVAQVFKMALGLPVDNLLRDGVFDVFGLDWTNVLNAGPSPETDVGRLLMVGAGSVGSSAVYCMKLAGVTGDVTIVDKDVIKVGNFNRSPIFGRRNFGLSKSEATAIHLTESGLRATVRTAWWNEYIEQLDRQTLQADVWLPLANEFGVRSSMQNNVPPVMVHASTTANWGVNHARHLPGIDDCLSDRFPSEVSDGELACATGEAVVEDERIDAALPFCSLFAGLLVTAELLRLQLPDYPQVPNFALLDWYGSLDTIQKWNMVPRPGCICRQQDRDLHETFNKATKYWSRFGF